MLDKIKLTVKHTFFYALGNLAPKLSGFILLPIYTKHISISDYGILGLLEVVEMISTQVLSFGLSQAQLRWYGLATNDQKKKSYIFTLLIFSIFVVLTNLLVVLFANGFLSRIVFDTTDYGNFLIIIAVTVCLTILNKIPLTLLRSEEKSNWYALTIMFQFSANLLSNIYFVVFLEKGIIGIIISQAISSGLTFVILLPYLAKRIVAEFDFDELKAMLKFSYPYIFSAIAVTTLNLGDRYILTKMTTLKEVGLYTLGYKFSNIIKVFVVDAFLLTLPTVGWKIIKDDNQPSRFVSKAMTYFVFILLWVALPLCVFSKGIIHKFALNKIYWDAYQVVPFLVLGVIISGMQGVLFFVLQIPMKTQKVAQIVAVAAVANVLLNLVLIPKFGMIGAAVATILAQLIGLLFAYQTSQAAYKVEYELGRLTSLFSVAIVLYFSTTLFDGFLLFQRIFYKGILIMAFPAILYFLNFYTEIEIARIKGSIKKWGGKILFRS